MSPTRECIAVPARLVLLIISIWLMGQILWTASDLRAESPGTRASPIVVPTCDRWGINSPGDKVVGISLGARLSEIKKPIEETSNEVRPYDHLHFMLVKFRGANGGPVVQAIHCDSGDPIFIGASSGELTQKTIGAAAWKSEETASLASTTGRQVFSSEQPHLLYLWSVKESRPVAGSAATDYVVLRRDCLVGKNSTPTTCVFVAWSVIRMRSLVSPMLTD